MQRWAIILYRSLLLTDFVGTPWTILHVSSKIDIVHYYAIKIWIFVISYNNFFILLCRS
jgi:hypothetical protein